jgi:hypothetical protein
VFVRDRNPDVIRLDRAVAVANQVDQGRGHRVAALWRCVDGYMGVFGADIKCGGFASQQDIQAYCEGIPSCLGYSYDNQQWWCTKLTGSLGNVVAGGRFCSRLGASLRSPSPSPSPRSQSLALPALPFLSRPLLS